MAKAGSSRSRVERDNTRMDVDEPSGSSSRATELKIRGQAEMERRRGKRDDQEVGALVSVSD